MWDHSHQALDKSECARLIIAKLAGTGLTYTPDGWKTELTYVTGYMPSRDGLAALTDGHHPGP